MNKFDEGVMVPQWLHKVAMAPKMKKLVRVYLNWRKKNPGQGAQGVQQVVKMMGLSPRDGNQLIDTLNNMIKQGKLPKHLALEATDYSKNYKEFINFATSDLGIKNKPKINITDKDLEGTFGYFEPHNNNITVSTRGRHQVDVMRTLAHELIHYKDRQAGKELDGADGSKDENNANAYAGVLLRKWALKKPHLFSESYRTDRWYKSQPEWGTKESDKKARAMTPGQIDEEDYDRKRDKDAERGIPRKKVMSFSTHSKRSPEDEAKRKANYKKAMAASLANIKKQFK